MQVPEQPEQLVARAFQAAAAELTRFADAAKCDLAESGSTAWKTRNGARMRHPLYRPI